MIASRIPGTPTTKNAILHPKYSLIQPPANKPNIIPNGIPREYIPRAVALMLAGK